MEICRYTLSFLFLEADGSIEIDLLLFRFKFFHLDMVLDHFPLVHDYENNYPYR